MRSMPCLDMTPITNKRIAVREKYCHDVMVCVTRGGNAMEERGLRGLGDL